MKVNLNIKVSSTEELRRVISEIKKIESEYTQGVFSLIQIDFI